MHHRKISSPAHDRRGLRRTDPDYLAACWADGQAQCVTLRGAAFATDGATIVWTPTSEAPDGERVFLGVRADRPYWAVLTPGAPEPDDSWVHLRTALLAGVAGDDSALLLHAAGIAEWRVAHRYCPRCAGTLEPRAAGHELVCASCGAAQYPRSDPAVIMAITHGEPGADDERVLVGRQEVWPEKRFSTLAGFCEPGESLEDAVRREVREEVGIEVGEVRYFHNQPWPLPSSLMMGFVGRALTTELALNLDEIAEARWFTRGELAQAVAADEVRLPTALSISRSLIEDWYGAPLPGSW